MLKFQEIGPNEAAKMLVRGILFYAPDPIREKYQDFVFPFYLGESLHIDTAEVSDEDNYQLASLILELKQVFEIDLVELQAIEKKSDRLKIVKEQITAILLIGERYLSAFSFYNQGLEIILSNLANRKIVDYSCLIEIQKAREQESKRESETKSTVESAQIISSNEKYYNLTESEENEQEEKMLEDFLNSYSPTSH